MLSKLQSYSIVPSDLYVERDADRQIKSVVQTMSRPGYVLVARQMGKTNLLLHTKSVLEDDKNVYAYIDLTNMLCTCESECYDEIIDIITDTHESLFEDEISLIEQRRLVRNITTQREFTRDLRLLLKKVDRLIIILDEIEALLKLSFSDNVFSLIRSHFFQRNNYPDMNKLSYLLAGVTEPKNIIKNPDISPFNISQRIYVRDFTLEEYNIFLQKTGLNRCFNADILSRVYFWTCGQPRMTWDLCQYISEVKPTTIDGVDDIVNEFYLNSTDKAPVDTIRAIVSSDSELSDAIIQMKYSKNDTFSSDVKSKLFLAGIISHEINSVRFKNPIIEKSLPETWLLSLNDKSKKTKESIDKAQRLIFIDNNYVLSQTILETLLATGAEEDVLDQVNWLLGECYYRQYKLTEAVAAYNNVTKTSEFYCKSICMEAQCYRALGDYTSSLKFFDQLLALSMKGLLRCKALIGKATTYIDWGEKENWDKAESTLKTALNESKSIEDELTIQKNIYFQSARLYRKRGNKELAISMLDSALSYANYDEVPVLLYEKLRVSDSREKSLDVLKDLVPVIREYNRTPVMEDFDNPIAFSKYYAILIFAEIILNYPEYETEIFPKYKWFFDKKEDLYSTICATLSKNMNPLAKRFAKLVIQRNSEADWNFQDFQIVDAFAIWTERVEERKELLEISPLLLNYLNSRNEVFSIPPLLIRPIIYPLNEEVSKKNIGHIHSVVQTASKWFNVAPEDKVSEEYFILTSFYTSYVAFQKRQIKWFMDAACMYLSRVEIFISNITDDDHLDYSVTSLQRTISIVREMGAIIKSEKERLNPDVYNIEKLSRNAKIRGFDYIHQRMIDGKLKSFESDIKSGFFEIKQVL